MELFFMAESIDCPARTPITLGDLLTTRVAANRQTFHRSLDIEHEKVSDHAAPATALPVLSLPLAPDARRSAGVSGNSPSNFEQLTEKVPVPSLRRNHILGLEFLELLKQADGVDMASK